MKWIFMCGGPDGRATLGARLHQSYAAKKSAAVESGKELAVISDERKYSLPKRSYGTAYHSGENLSQTKA